MKNTKFERTYFMVGPLTPAILLYFCLSQSFTDISTHPLKEITSSIHVNSSIVWGHHEKLILIYLYLWWKPCSNIQQQLWWWFVIDYTFNLLHLSPTNSATALDSFIFHVVEYVPELIILSPCCSCSWTLHLLPNIQIYIYGKI